VARDPRRAQENTVRVDGGLRWMEEPYDKVDVEIV
jgi:hypothetical protein